MQPPIPLYKLIFGDNTEYIGGHILTPKWRESPDKAIFVFKLRLPSGDFLYLNNYEEYNFFVEVIANIYGAKGTHLTYMYLMGCENGVVTSYRISLNMEGQGIGDMTVRQFPRGKEYNGKPTTGWHKGWHEKIGG